MAIKLLPDGNYVEPECVITHEGRTFESGGACLLGNYLACYLGNDGQAITWHGDVIGTFRITSTWRVPNGWVSGKMHQVEVNLGNGIIFTGRSSGVGMLFKGRRKVTRS